MKLALNRCPLKKDINKPLLLCILLQTSKKDFFQAGDCSYVRMSLRWRSEVRKFHKMHSQETFLEYSVNISLQPSRYPDVLYKARFEELNSLSLRSGPTTVVKSTRNSEVFDLPGTFYNCFQKDFPQPSHTLLPSTNCGKYLSNILEGLHRIWADQLSTGREKCIRKIDTVEHQFFRKRLSLF